MLPISTTYIKARKWPLLIVYLLLGVPVLVAFLEDGTEDHQQKIGIICFLVFSHLLFFFFWYVVRKMEIQLYHDSFVYKTAFKTKEIVWQNIMKSEFEFSFHGHSGDVKWRIESPQTTIAMSVGYFSRSDCRLIAEVLVDKYKEAKISENIKAMAKGRFPWYVFLN